MSYHDIKLRPNDTLFSNYIRQKANWKCEYCGKACKIDGEWIGKLEASHYHGRRKESTRYDTDNVHALCFSCHKRMGGHTREEKGEYDLWMKELLGEQRYKTLLVRANTIGKRDNFIENLKIKELLKSL